MLRQFGFACKELEKQVLFESLISTLVLDPSSAGRKFSTSNCETPRLARGVAKPKKHKQKADKIVRKFKFFIPTFLIQKWVANEPCQGARELYNFYTHLYFLGYKYGHFNSQ